MTGEDAGEDGRYPDASGVEPAEATPQDRLRAGLDESVLLPLRVAWADWRTRIGVSILAGFVAVGLLAWLEQAGVGVLSGLLDAAGAPWSFGEPAPIESPDEAWRRGLRPFESAAHPLGTDPAGRDLLSGVVWATSYTLQAILAGVVATAVVGTAAGAVAGYAGGRTEVALESLANVTVTLPGIPLALLLVVVASPRSPTALGVLLTVPVWGSLARRTLVRARALRDRDHVEASRAMGIRTSTILRTAVLPALLPDVLRDSTYAARRVLYDGTALYFLGFLPATAATNWGVLLNRGYETYGALAADGPTHALAVPLVPVVVLAAGLVLFAEGSERLFDPRERARVEGTDPASVPAGVLPDG